MKTRSLSRWAVILLVLACLLHPAAAAAGGLGLRELTAALTLRHYNTRLVVLSTGMLGAAAGVVGTFLLLRKRSLMGDVLSHACLPGIALTFMLMVALGGTGKALAGLLAGAVATGLAGVVLTSAIRNHSRIQHDAAMGIVLSVFFGFGVVLLGLVQSMPGAAAAGLEYFIYGKAASMVRSDFYLIMVVALVVILAAILFFKEFSLFCFDEPFAATQGWPVKRLDLLMLVLVVAATVTGLRAVGLILIIAFLITPPAAARFWTHDLRRMLVIAGVLGGASGWAGASISALFPGMPAGAVIVCVAAAIFVFSMLFGTAKGAWWRLLQGSRQRRKTGMQNLLRTTYELIEDALAAPGSEPPTIAVASLLPARSWTRRRLARLLRRAVRARRLSPQGTGAYRLTGSGLRDAARITRNHRLWEMYLICCADVAPVHVDQNADRVEHVLEGELVERLEAEMARYGLKVVPAESLTLPEGAR